MRRWMKRAGFGALGLVAAALALYTVAWWHSERALQRHYVIGDAPLSVPQDAAAIAQGRHLYLTRGCADCHGRDGGGTLVMDIGPLLRVVAPNITPATLAVRGYDSDRIAAAIRHGVGADGTPLVFMPARDWMDLGDADTAALVAYLGTLPASANDPGTLRIRPLARVLHLFDAFPLLPAEHIDHTPRVRDTPAPAADADYGRYVAAACTGCHGDNLAGRGPIAPGTPPVANLTPAGPLAGWSEADFVRAMREGRRPDGRMLDPFMPWKAFATMTDIELRALWLHLRALPAANAAD